MSQPIFYITRSNLNHIFQGLRENGFIPHPDPGHSCVWGSLKNKEELFSALDALKDDNDFIVHSQVHDVLNSFETPKLARNANSALNYYKRRLKFYRQLKGDPLLWCFRKEYERTGH